MYKYEYEKVVCELGGWGVFSGNVYSIEDYRKLLKNEQKMDGDMLVLFLLNKEEQDIFKKWI